MGEAEKSIYNGGIKDYISRLRSNTTTEKELRASKSDRLIPLLTVLFELEHTPLHTQAYTEKQNKSAEPKNWNRKTLLYFCLNLTHFQVIDHVFVCCNFMVIFE